MRRGGIRFGGRARTGHKYRAKPHWVDVSGPPYTLTDHAYLLAECGQDRKRALAEGRRLGWAYCSSQAEARRYQELLFLRDDGRVRDLRAQVPFALSTIRETGELVTIGEYVADFVYERNGARVIEDVKGLPTEMYRWKKRHMWAEYGIEIAEVRSRG